MPVTNLPVQGVVVDGSEPINFIPSVQILHLAVGTNGLVVCSVVGSNGLAIDLTGCAAQLSIKQAEDDLAPLIARAGVVTDEAGGVVEFALTPNDTIPLRAGSFVYDIGITFGNSTVAQVVPSSGFILDANPGVGTITPTIPLPSMLGQTGKVLGTDGTNLRWQNVTGNFNWRGDWTSGIAFAVNDVAEDGSYGAYICTVAINPSNTAPHSDSGHWDVLAPGGPAGPPPPGGVDGDIVQRQSGVPAYATPADVMANAGLGVTRSGGSALSSSGAFVELMRYTPGANKTGLVDLLAKGTTAAPSKASIWDQVGFRTNGAGTVFVQGNLPGPWGGTVPSYAGAGIPGAPTGLSATVNPGVVEISFTAGAGETDAVMLEISTNSGVTYTRLLSSLASRGPFTSVSVTVDNDLVPASTPVKFKVIAMNDYGEAVSAALDVTTDIAADGSSGLNPDSPWYPIGQAQYDDTRPYWVHINGQVSGGAGSFDLVLLGVGADLVLKCRAKNSYAGTVSFRADIAIGPSL